jgi:hypothetical protein
MLYSDACSFAWADFFSITDKWCCRAFHGAAQHSDVTVITGCLLYMRGPNLFFHNRCSLPK